jgi:hypothetical protein
LGLATGAVAALYSRDAAVAADDSNSALTTVVDRVKDGLREWREELQSHTAQQNKWTELVVKEEEKRLLAELARDRAANEARFGVLRAAVGAAAAAQRYERAAELDALKRVSAGLHDGQSALGQMHMEAVKEQAHSHLELTKQLAEIAAQQQHNHGALRRLARPCGPGPGTAREAATLGSTASTGRPSESLRRALLTPGRSCPGDSGLGPSRASGSSGGAGSKGPAPAAGARLARQTYRPPLMEGLPLSTP